MYVSPTKIRPNDLCHCGSDTKYKKCCYSTDKHNLPTRLEDNSDYVLEQNLNISMSEVILNLADDLLFSAKTKAHREFAISITCSIWNMLVENIDKPEMLQTEIEKIVNFIDFKEGQDEIRAIIFDIMEKKILLYPTINRTIVDYKITGNKKKWDLIVMSAIEVD
jgi:hypothetical protein